MLTIGDLKLSSRLVLSPMAGITDLPFRMLNRKFGCQLAFVEMINVRSLSYKSKKTAHMLSTGRKDKPLGIQLLGAEEKFIVRAMDILQKYDFDLLDFNSACPARKVVIRQEGASLLKDPKKLNKLLKVVVARAKTPVTVKIRSGWDDDSVNAREVALYAQDAGVSAVFIHGRTKMQEYRGQVDYRPIALAKKALEIPVIGSGDVFSPALAKKMLDETGCDGLAVARGALGNPWIFPETEALLSGNKVIPRPSPDAVIDIMLEHFADCVKFYKGRDGVVIFRKFFGWYTKGMHNVRYLREKACHARSEEEMSQVINQLKSA